MSWHAGLIDGPIAIPILGEPDAEGARELLGYVPGYHMNVAPQCYAETMSAYRVEPDSPHRVFAGAECVFLAFPDEATARAHLSAYWIDSD